MSAQSRASGAGKFVAFASIALASFGAAGRAQEAQKPDLASCYWQDALNGVFCDHSYAVRAGVAEHALEWSSQTFNTFRNIGSATRHDHYRPSWVDALGVFEVTPTPWLKLSVGGDFQSFRDEDDYFFTTKGGARNPGPGSKILRAADWGSRSAEANVKLYDSGAGDARYVVHVFADAGAVAGADDADAQARLGAGAETGARLALSSALALNARATLSYDHFSDLSANALYPSARALVSYDAGGFAIGPAYDGAALVSENGGVSGRRQTELAGGEALVQPFVTLKNAVLDGVILDAKAEHTVGPATFDTPGKASGETYAATVSFNFHY